MRSETSEDQSVDPLEFCRAYAEMLSPDVWWTTVRGWDGVYRQMYVGPALTIELTDFVTGYTP